MNTLLPYLHNPVVAWLLVGLVGVLLNWICREGGAVDAWAQKNSPRLHGLILIARGILPDLGPALLGVYKSLAGDALPPAWLVALLPLAPPTPKAPAASFRRPPPLALLATWLFALVILVTGAIVGCQGTTPGQVIAPVVNGLSIIQQECVAAKAGTGTPPEIAQACTIDIALTPVVEDLLNLFAAQRAAGAASASHAAAPALCPPAVSSLPAAPPPSASAPLTGRRRL